MARNLRFKIYIAPNCGSRNIFSCGSFHRFPSLHFDGPKIYFQKMLGGSNELVNRNDVTNRKNICMYISLCHLRMWLFLRLAFYFQLTFSKQQQQSKSNENFMC